MLSKKRGKLKITVADLFKARPIWPVIVVEEGTERVISLSQVDENALRKTLRTGLCHYWDDVNRVVYLKGEHSNEIETLRQMRLDICHARRHLPYLLFRVDLAPGKCKFGVDLCHFHVFDGKTFSLDEGCVIDEKACKDHWERVNTLLTEKEDRDHMRRFGPGKKLGAPKKAKGTTTRKRR